MPQGKQHSALFFSNKLSSCDLVIAKQSNSSTEDSDEFYNLLKYANT